MKRFCALILLLAQLLSFRLGGFSKEDEINQLGKLISVGDSFCYVLQTDDGWDVVVRQASDNDGSVIFHSDQPIYWLSSASNSSFSFAEKSLPPGTIRRYDLQNKRIELLTYGIPTENVLNAVLPKDTGSQKYLITMESAKERYESYFSVYRWVEDRYVRFVERCSEAQICGDAVMYLQDRVYLKYPDGRTYAYRGYSTDPVSIVLSGGYAVEYDGVGYRVSDIHRGKSIWSDKESLNNVHGIEGDVLIRDGRLFRVLPHQTQIVDLRTGQIRSVIDESCEFAVNGDTFAWLESKTLHMIDIE